MYSDDGFIDQPRTCPICAEPYLVYITKKKTNRTKRDLPLYGCLACRSFSNPSGYIEDELQLELDFEWHKTVEERNTRSSRVVFKDLKKRGTNFSRILEIGSGTGTFLKAAKEFGAQGIGYDVNPLTRAYARDVNNVDVRSEFWSADTDCGPFSILVCISVLEHIAEPRAILRDMVEACLRENAQLFISVPLVAKDKWKYLYENNPRAPGNPFFDQDVHVTHFSPEGLENTMMEFGMSSVERIETGMWQGALARP